MIFLKSIHEIDTLRVANQIVAGALEVIGSEVREGVTTRYLDDICESYIREKGGIPAFKGYKGFPNSLCISINDEIVHGIPCERKLKNGDIVSCDVGVKFDGYYGDSAVTYPVGNVSELASRLMKTTEEALYLGISKAVAGNRLYDIGSAVQRHVEKNDFSVVRVFVGHGIGRQLHEEPQIPNYGPAGKGVKLREGMVLAIEPMVNIGSEDVKILNDGWTAVTKDGSLSAHFEHSIVVQKGEPEILSQRNREFSFPEKTG